MENEIIVWVYMRIILPQIMYSTIHVHALMHAKTWVYCSEYHIVGYFDGVNIFVNQPQKKILIIQFFDFLCIFLKQKKTQN